ncbi:tyrosine-type recombinase/integrase [Bordetella sp. FB-8]|uniref:tyrosine-type recombinase/integrase n=1 Tax=Bordetella sp. FB-8 TaxID=1159870 RepID=UPI000687756C|nr:tyrosine-type recombinase/integrase [Bordetella sp. FB-8]
MAAFTCPLDKDQTILRDAEQTATDQEKRRKARVSKTPALDAWDAYIQARAPRWSDRYAADLKEMAREGGDPITRGRRAGMAATKPPGILRPLLALPLRGITRDAVAAWLEKNGHARPTFAVRALLNRIVSAYLQILLLTGARRNELAGLRWEDVDFQWQSLTIRDKVEGERTIGMTPYVASLLRGLQRINEMPPNVRALRGQPEGQEWRPSPWVFASKTAADGRMKEPRIAHNKALAAAGLPALSIHGLRRSFGTLAEWVECPAGISAQIMGHKPSAIAEKHYRRRPLDLLRMWHGKIEGWILDRPVSSFRRSRPNRGCEPSNKAL